MTVVQRQRLAANSPGLPLYEAGAKVIRIKDSVLMVWQRQGGQWKLIERQAYKT